MIVDPKNYLPQAIIWIGEADDVLLNTGDEHDRANQKAMLADSLVQLEIAKQLGRVADSLDQLVRTQQR